MLPSTICILRHVQRLLSVLLCDSRVNQVSGESEIKMSEDDKNRPESNRDKIKDEAEFSLKEVSGLYVVQSMSQDSVSDAESGTVMDED